MIVQLGYSLKYRPQTAEFQRAAPTAASFAAPARRPTTAPKSRCHQRLQICLAHEARPCSLLNKPPQCGPTNIIGGFAAATNLSVRWWRQVPTTVTADNCFSLNGFRTKWALFCLAPTRLPRGCKALRGITRLESLGVRDSRFGRGLAGRHKAHNQQRNWPKQNTRAKPTATTAVLA